MSGNNERPNILLITTDQQHWRLMSCEGDEYVRTPNLDRLAADGVLFENAYCTNPVCVPSRFSFMSGRMPHVFGGLEDNRKIDVSQLPRISDYVDTPPLGRLFMNAGYNTALGGKLHVGAHYKFSPEDQEEFGFSYLTDDFRTELAERSAEFLLATPAEPFFLWTSFDNPHDICFYLYNPAHDKQNPQVSPRPPLPDNFAPTESEIDWIRAFRDGTLGTEEQIELGLNRSFGRIAQSWSEEEWRSYRANYRYYMEQVDSQIGTVLDALSKAGLEDNTVVVFTSDHGEHDGAHGLTMKRSFYEESVHVPLIVRDPRIHRRGVRETPLVSNGVDLMPTLCDIAGIELPSGSRPSTGSSPRPDNNGRSLYPIVAGESIDTWRDFVVSETVGGRMLLKDGLKYIVHHFGKSEEMLFDLANDPGEMHNLAVLGAYADRMIELRRLLGEWTKDNGDVRGASYIAALANNRDDSGGMATGL